MRSRFDKANLYSYLDLKEGSCLGKSNKRLIKARLFGEVNLESVLSISRSEKLVVLRIPQAKSTDK